MLASAAAGDEIAFRRLIAAHHEDMRRVCRAIAGDDAMADEAVEAAWVVAWKKLHKVRGPAQLRPWLVSVAVNEAKQLLRKRRTRARFEITTDSSEAPGGIDPATGVSGMDLREAISRLAPDDRALLALRYVAGFDSNDLAVATGKKPTHCREDKPSKAAEKKPAKKAEKRAKKAEKKAKLDLTVQFLDADGSVIDRVDNSIGLKAGQKTFETKLTTLKYVVPLIKNATITAVAK